MDINIYTNLCTKITSGNKLGNGGNTRGSDDNSRINDGNTRDKPCQLKLNDIDCHVNYHVRIDAQVGIHSIVELHNDIKYLKY